MREFHRIGAVDGRPRYSEVVSRHVWRLRSLVPSVSTIWLEKRKLPSRVGMLDTHITSLAALLTSSALEVAW